MHSNKRYTHWLKLQRRYRRLQRRWMETPNNQLAKKLDMLRRRLHRINRRWRLGITTAALTAWLMLLPGGAAQAQVQPFEAEVQLADLEGATTGFKIFGEDADDFSGVSVSSAGDVNGDGIADLLVGAYYASPNEKSNAGTTYVVFGRDIRTGAPFPDTLELASLSGDAGFKLFGENEDDNSGRSVSSAGDVNGDGIADLLVGASGASPNENRGAGTTYVVFGRDDPFPDTLDLASLSGDAGFKLFGENAFDISGFSVSSAGDVNGDGIADLLVGASSADPNENPSAGITYVVFGRDIRTGDPFPDTLDLASLSGDAGFKLFGENSFDYSGRSVSSAGDVNGDGIADLLVGAINADPNENPSAGITYVVFGRDIRTGDPFPDTLQLASLSGNAGFKLFGENEFDSSGRSVSSAGDVNGDGIADLLIGASGADPNENPFAGTTYVVFGRDSQAGASFPDTLDLADLSGDAGFKLFGENEDDRSGGSVSSAGDVNGDGIADLLVGALFADPNEKDDAGITYVVFGRKKPLAPQVNSELADATVVERALFTYTVPVNTFTDANPADVLILSATQANGPLPNWLSFDPATGTFSGTPNSEDVGTLEITVTATDPDGLSVSDNFTLTVNDRPLSIEDPSGITFYPNPVGDRLTVKGTTQAITAYVTDLLGKPVIGRQSGLTITLDLSSLTAGIYLLVVEEGSKVATHKIIKTN